jgi:hypothetical protein
MESVNIFEALQDRLRKVKKRGLPSLDKQREKPCR